MTSEIPPEELFRKEDSYIFYHKNCWDHEKNAILNIPGEFCWGCRRKVNKKALFLLKINWFNLERKASYDI